MIVSITTSMTRTRISTIATPVSPKWIALTIRITAPREASSTGGRAIHRRRGSV
jgi:hypothetical protein